MFIYYVECEECAYDHKGDLIVSNHYHDGTAYTDEKKAIAQITKKSDEIMNELLREGANPNYLTRDTDANGCYAIVHNGKNEVFEYSISKLNVE